jgi:hypothetical protein
MKTAKQPSDDRVASVAKSLVFMKGRNAAMDFAHIQRIQTDTAKRPNRGLVFGEAFWNRVIAALHEYRRQP